MEQIIFLFTKREALDETPCIWSNLGMALYLMHKFKTNISYTTLSSLLSQIHSLKTINVQIQ